MGTNYYCLNTEYHIFFATNQYFLNTTPAVLPLIPLLALARGCHLATVTIQVLIVALP